MGFENIKKIGRASPARFRGRVLLLLQDSPVALGRTALLNMASTCGLKGYEREIILKVMTENGEIQMWADKSNGGIKGARARQLYYLKDSQLELYKLNLTLRKLETWHRIDKRGKVMIDQMDKAHLTKYKETLLKKLRYINERLQDEQPTA